MGKNTNSSIEKLDKQIEKLTKGEYDDSKTPSISKKELSRKIKLAKIDEEMKKNKNKKVKTSSSVTTKTIKLDEIKEQVNKTKAKPVKKTTKKTSSDKTKKSVKITKKVASKLDELKESYKVESLNKKELINEVLDNQSEVDKLIKLLTKVFTILISLLVILFLIVCFI